MKRLSGRLHGFLTSFWNDTSGIMLPYVALMIPVLMGFSLLALDAARFQSLQTQMQAAADALALAGARELDQKSGARARSTSAMANSTFGNNNTLSGMGTTPTFTYTSTFYRSLPAAQAGLTGVAATSDQNAKFVLVTVAPVTVPTTFPVGYFISGGANSFSTGAAAIAGFTAQTICDIPPVFICNPYETAGNTNDATATAALQTAFDDPATLRKQLRMNASTTGPGHFGFLIPPDGCNGANCLSGWIATATPRTCYQTSGVDLNTGAKTGVNDGFNVRFDMYPNGGGLGPSTTYPPAINVRKGTLPKNGSNFCTPDTPTPYYTTLPTYSHPIVQTTGTTATTGTDRKNILNMPSGDISNVFSGQMITGNNIKIPNSVVGTPSGGKVPMNDPGTGSGSTSLTIKWPTSGLPLDSNLAGDATLLFGNGNWDCANYWALNHTLNGALTYAAPPGCTSSNPTVSRYQVYRYEIAHSLINDFSGNGLAYANGGKGNGESGAPFCAAGSGVSGVDTTTGGKDRRIIMAAIINCEAQSALITGGQTANNVPVAAFGKFFMTQPVGIDPPPNNSSLTGEMTGFVTLNDTTILNQVQLYR